MSAKVKASITTEFIRVEGKPAWLVRGFTTGIKEILLADGATWDGQRIGWVYVGQTLPVGIKQAIDSVLGKVDPAAPPPALKPVAVPQSSPSHPVAKVEGAAVKLAAKFRDWGSRLQKDIDHKLRPWGDAAPTHKRIGEYKSRIADGLELQLLQDRLYAIATGLEAGTLPDSLTGVKDKTLVQRLAKRELPPHLFIYANEAKALIEVNSDVPALLDGVHRLQTEAGQFDDHKTHFGKDTLADLLAVLNLCGSGIAPGLRDRIERWQAAAAAKIEEPQRWTDAVAALEAIGHPQAGKLTKELELQFARLDIAQSSIPGYFPTPPNVVAHLLTHFKPQPGDTVLEPSAGSGHIAEAIRQRHPEVTLKVIEWNLSLCNILQLQGFTLIGNDFFEELRKWDWIVMNPPFEKGEDMKHIQYAYKHLTDKGRVIAICSASLFGTNSKAAREFREWLDLVGAHYERLPEGAFKASERSTGVQAYLVVIDRHPAPQDEPDIPDEEAENGEPETPASAAEAAVISTEKPLPDDLPERQIEMLLDIRQGYCSQKNAATRNALRNYGLVTDTDDWRQLALTERGQRWLAELPVLSNYSQIAQDMFLVLNLRQKIYQKPLHPTTLAAELGCFDPPAADEPLSTGLERLKTARLIKPTPAGEWQVTRRGESVYTFWEKTKGVPRHLRDMAYMSQSNEKSTLAFLARLKPIFAEHIEPDGTDKRFAIEAKYGLEQGEDWLPEYWRRKAARPTRPYQRGDTVQRTDDKRRAIILDPLVTGAVAEVRVLHPIGIPVSTFTAIQTESWPVADFTLEKAIDDPPVTTAALRQPGEYRTYKKGERVRNTETGKIGVVDRDTLGAWARVRILGTDGKPSDITTDWTLNLVEPADEAAVPEAKSVFQSNRIPPLRQQYLNLKAQYPDFVLFYRLGDFYETFDADAEITAQELDLVLTSRPVSRDQRVPMAGVPYHALEPYVTKLIEKGYSVAVAEQMGEPNGTGIVERRVERVLTPSHSSQTAKTGVLNDLNPQT